MLPYCYRGAIGREDKILLDGTLMKKGKALVGLLQQKAS